MIATIGEARLTARPVAEKSGFDVTLVHPRRESNAPPSAHVVSARIWPLDSDAVPTTAELQAAGFKRGTKVRLVDDIPGYPTGSQGKVAVANGMTWKRYWVRFPDGTAVGHVDHQSLVKAKDFDQFLEAREREAIEAEKAAELAAEAASNPSAAASGGGDAGGADPVVNGVAIPQHLIERSAAARTRLAG